MAMRLQEVHPSVVHFPLALVPLSIGADLIGRMTGSATLRSVARTTMPLAAASAAVAAAFGLVAQEEVNATGEAHDMLVTQRNLNLAMVGTAAAMAAPGRSMMSRAQAISRSIGRSADAVTRQEDVWRVRPVRLPFACDTAERARWPQTSSIPDFDGGVGGRDADCPVPSR